MTNVDRRSMLRAGFACVVLPSAMVPPGRAPMNEGTSRDSTGVTDTSSAAGEIQVGSTLETRETQIPYLEIVTSDVEAVCATYSKLHGITFGDSDPALGGALTAKLAHGGMLGVRAPLHDGEKPVVRPYVLVEDIEAAMAVAAKSGAETVVPPMKLEGHGSCAIFLQGGIESGLWQH